MKGPALTLAALLNLLLVSGNAGAVDVCFGDRCIVFGASKMDFTRPFLIEGAASHCQEQDPPVVVGPIVVLVRDFAGTIDGRVYQLDRLNVVIVTGGLGCSPPNSFHAQVETGAYAGA